MMKGNMTDAECVKMRMMNAADCEGKTQCEGYEGRGQMGMMERMENRAGTMPAMDDDEND